MVWYAMNMGIWYALVMCECYCTMWYVMRRAICVMVCFSECVSGMVCFCESICMRYGMMWYVLGGQFLLLYHLVSVYMVCYDVVFLKRAISGQVCFSECVCYMELFGNLRGGKFVL